MRLTTLTNSARSRLLSCLLIFVFVSVPLSGAFANAGSDADVEVYKVDDTTLSSGTPCDDADNIDGEDEGDPIDVDYMTAMQLFLVALRTLR